MTVKSPCRRRRSGAKTVSLVLFSILRTVYRAVLRFKKAHQQVKLGVSKQELNKTIQFKSESNVEQPAVRMLIRKEILAEAAD